MNDASAFKCRTWRLIVNKNGAIKQRRKIEKCPSNKVKPRGGSIGGAIAPPLAANFLNVVCEFSEKFFFFFCPYYQQICGKEGKFAVSLGRRKAKKLSSSRGGGLRPLTPWPGALPPDPRYRLGLPRSTCSPPKETLWIHPW